jgi:CHAD domain-containing protein
LRYTAELFAGLYSQRPVAEFTQRLKRLQDGLGAANDVHIAATLIDELGKSAEKGADIV